MNSQQNILLISVYHFFLSDILFIYVFSIVAPAMAVMGTKWKATWASCGRAAGKPDPLVDGGSHMQACLCDDDGSQISQPLILETFE